VETASATSKPLGVDSDKELVARCQEELPDKTEAYLELLQKYEPMVYGTCLRMLGNVQDAEETCQDAFVRVFHKIHQFEGRSAFKTWLFRVVYNFCMTKRRNLATKRERNTTISDEITQEAKAQQANQQADESAHKEAVQNALGKLSDDDREVIVLRFFSELSLEEIADVLELKLSATKMRLYRALDRFKEIYGPKGAIDLNS
jgi:RNA polymerase sigma-70 factor (ECF subfamily)